MQPLDERRSSRRRTGARSAVVAVVTALALALAVGSASAHQPVFVTEADPDPTQGPLLEDGSLSFAVYGTLGAKGDTRGVRTRLRTGDPLVVDLLIPALAPEQDLSDRRLPFVVLQLPDGTERRLLPDRRIRFDEPFSGTSYLRLVDLRETAPTDGIYGITVVARAPARFTLATGVTEGVRGVVTDAEPSPTGGLGAWYSTPPAAPTTSTTTTPGRSKRGKGSKSSGTKSSGAKARPGQTR